VRRYVRELERLGVPVEQVILFGSHRRGDAGPDSDVDLAVFSDVFGPPGYLEFSGVLSEAKWNTEPMIEAAGFHPSVLKSIPPISFLHEIAETGEVVYRRTRSLSSRRSR
jgi:predicted nucleotidyltransferase